MRPIEAGQFKLYEAEALLTRRLRLFLIVMAGLLVGLASLGIKTGNWPVLAIVSVCSLVFYMIMIKEEGGSSKLRHKTTSFGFQAQTLLLLPAGVIEASYWSKLSPTGHASWNQWLLGWLPAGWQNSWQWLAIALVLGTLITIKVRVEERKNYHPLAYFGKSKTTHDYLNHMLAITVPVIFGGVPVLLLLDMGRYWMVVLAVFLLIVGWLVAGAVFDLKRFERDRKLRRILHPLCIDGKRINGPLSIGGEDHTAAQYFAELKRRNEFGKGYQSD